MRVPVVSIIIVSIAVGLSIPVLADRKQAKEEQVCVNELKALIETESIETDLVVESKEELKKELCPQESVYESQYNFDTLREENKDIIAWINIPGTNVDYPVLFDGTDEYLHKNLGGEDSASGCIYVDATTKNVLDDEINIIYGHNMKNGTMFGELQKFKDNDYFESHPYIEIHTPNEVRVYQIFSVRDVSSDIDTLNFAMSDFSKKEYIEKAINESIQSREVAESQIITLSTCVGDYSRRLLVSGVRIH